MTELALIESVMDEWMTSEDPTAVIRRTIRQARNNALEEAACAVECYHSTISHSIDIRTAAAAIRALKGAG